MPTYRDTVSSLTLIHVWHCAAECSHYSQLPVAGYHLLLAHMNLTRDDETMQWSAKVHGQQLLHWRRHDHLIVRLQPRDAHTQCASVIGALLANGLHLEQLFDRL